MFSAKYCFSATMVKFSMPILNIFVHNRSVLDVLPKFYLLRTLELTFFGPFFREFTAAISFPCSKFWLRVGENDGWRKILHGLKL